MNMWDTQNIFGPGTGQRYWRNNVGNLPNLPEYEAWRDRHTPWGSKSGMPPGVDPNTAMQMQAQMAQTNAANRSAILQAILGMRTAQGASAYLHGGVRPELQKLMSAFGVAGAGNGPGWGQPLGSGTGANVISRMGGGG